MIVIDCPSAKKEARTNSALIVAFFAAALAFLANTIVSFWSNYLTRRDQHVEEADKCNGLAASLISTSVLARDTAQAASTPVPPDKVIHRFILPPIDEILHSQDSSLGIIDPASRNLILQLEAYYRTIRDDLSHTNTKGEVKAEGDTFELAPDSPNHEVYENLLRNIAKVAGATVESLDKSSFCDELAETHLLSSRPRPHPHIAPQ